MIFRRKGSAMKKISIDSIVGGEKLAKEVCTTNGMILIPAGSIIKTDYIEKMKELNIDYIYIQSENDNETDEVDMNYKKIDVVKEEKIQNECKNMVKDTIERYTYCASEKLHGIATVAEQIMEDILSVQEVMYNVSCVRDKSESTYSHSVNVSALSVLIGLQMKLSRTRVMDLAIGALLHDIGLAYLPFDSRSIIYDECDEEKKRAIRNHVIIGYSMVESEEWLSPVAKEIILSHHEREDGSGYPMRLTSDKTRIETKIVALCSEFDSRVYGGMIKPEKVHLVMDYILSEAGRKFSLKVVQKFIESVAVYPIGTYVLTNKNEVGVVVNQNYKMPTRPIIKLLQEEDGKPVYRDLVKELTTFIIDTVDNS